MNLITQLDQFHQTTTGYVVFSLAELAGAYVTWQWAQESAWVWILFVVFVLGFIQNLVKLIAKVVGHER